MVKKKINYATDKKVFWEDASDESNIKQVFVTEHNQVGMSLKGRTALMSIESWFKIVDISDSMSYKRTNIIEKIAYWYLFERKIKSKF